MSTDYQARARLAALRNQQFAGRGRISGIPPVGSPVSPENAGMLTARGPIAEVYDVIDADGNPVFILGTTGLTDGTTIE